MNKKRLTMVGLTAAVILCVFALWGCGQKSDTGGGPPAMEGPTAQTLKEGYARTVVDGFSVTGDNVTTYKQSGDKRIVWSSINNNLSVVAGLEIGAYEVVIAATNGNPSQDCTHTFTLTVADRFNLVDGWYLISTPEEFNAIHTAKETGDLDKKYKLANDLDFKGQVALFSNSEPGSPKRALTGIFDGNGYAIKNAKVAKTASGAIWRMGIFGHVKGGTVRNLKFIDSIAYDTVNNAGGVAFGTVEGEGALIENIYFETHLTHAQSGSTTQEHGNSAFIAWCYGGAEVKNVVAVITTEPGVDFKRTALLVGLGSNGPVGGKLTNVFVVTDSTSVTDIYNGKLGSGDLVQNNVRKYGDMDALKAAQGTAIAGWGGFWDFLFA